MLSLDTLALAKKYTDEHGGGGGEPAAYIKDAAVANEKLTLTKKDSSTVELDVSTKLDKPTEPVAGQGINVPYYFDVEYNQSDVVVKDYTIDLLDKTKAPQQFQLRITAASEQKAGLMEAVDKVKINKLNQVEANPTLAGSESQLTGLKVGETSYKISTEAPQLALEGTSGTLTAEQLAVLANKSAAIMRDNKLHTFHSSTSTSSGELRTYSLIIDNNVCPMYHYILVNMLTGNWNAYKTDLQDKLTAGTNIAIDEVSHTISATDTTYTAGTNITIDDKNVISATGGTTVVANPTLAGTEAELIGLQVGDTKYAIPTNRNFPSTWPISDTCQAFLEAVGADSTATVGRTYQGGVEFSDLDDDLGLYNAEAEVEIISSTLSSGYKVIRLNIYSATNEPYSWARIYWWRGTASSSTMKPWQITARAADQYTKPYYTGTCNKTTGAISLDSTLSKGVYLVNIYGTQSTSQISYTYYFAYGGYQDWMTYSTDSNGTSVSALSGTLTMSKVSGGELGWDADATVEIYKMR